MTGDGKIRMAHIRGAQMCSSGVRDWAKLHNIDFNDFLKNGIDVEVVRNTGDALALQVVKVYENGVK
jgi:hypothetical protein